MQTPPRSYAYTAHLKAALQGNSLLSLPGSKGDSRLVTQRHSPSLTLRQGKASEFLRRRRVSGAQFYDLQSRLSGNRVKLSRQDSKNRNILSNTYIDKVGKPGKHDLKRSQQDECDATSAACIRISEDCKPDEGLKKDGSVSAEKEPFPRIGCISFNIFGSRARRLDIK